MKNLSLMRKFLLMGALLAAVVGIGVALVVVGTFNMRDQSIALSEREIPVLNLSHELKLSTVQVQQFLTDVGATRRPDAFAEAEEDARRFQSTVAELSRIDAENAAAYRALLPVFDRYYTAGKEMARAYIDQGTEAGNRLMPRFDESAKEIATHVDRFVEEARHHSARLAQEQRGYLERARVVTLTALPVILLVMGISAFILYRTLRLVPQLAAALERVAAGDLGGEEVVSACNDEIGTLASALNRMRRALRELVGGLSATASHMAAAARQLSQLTGEADRRVEAQRNGLTHMAAAMEQLSASAHEVARSSGAAAGATHQAERAVAESRAIVAESIRSIEHLAAEVERAAEVIATLDRDSDNIGSILEVIRGIAEQTNLLALNAAIEAARAGEQGRGFAVVADEVRTLAGRTRQATEEIRTMIEALQGNAKNAVQAMTRSRDDTRRNLTQAGRAEEHLAAITAAVATITAQTAQIASAAQQQGSVTGELATEVNHLSEGADETAAGSRQIAAAGQELARRSEQLSEMMGRFRV